MADLDGGGPYGLAVDGEDRGCFSGGPRRLIGCLDLSSNVLSKWKLPSWSNGLWALVVATDGSVFFNEFLNYICRFDPASGRLTRWDVSAFSLNLIEIAVPPWLSRKELFFTEQLLPPPPRPGGPAVGGNKIGLLAP